MSYGLVIGGTMSEKVTTQEAADILGYNRRHIYRLLKSGVLTAERFGPVWMIDREDVKRIKAQQNEHGRLPPKE